MLSQIVIRALRALGGRSGHVGRLLFLTLLHATSALASPSQSLPTPDRPVLWTQRADVQAFIQKMVQTHGFNPADLNAWFIRSGRAEQALTLMAPTPHGNPRVWRTYRSQFIEPKRLRAGQLFWREHAATLRRASQKWGVPEAIMVAIIGIETFYGRQTGRFQVFETLTTLAFEDPRRAPYFLSELEHFLLWTRDAGKDPFNAQGSFAGAQGLPQFMPSSLRRYAVDFDDDGRIDLLSSPADAIGSVANFLAQHGWRTGQVTHLNATITRPEHIPQALAAGLPPRLSGAELQAMGITSSAGPNFPDAVALIDLPNGAAATEYVLGTHNFWVITRYNRSYFYAMAVIELAQALAEQV